MILRCGIRPVVTEVPPILRNWADSATADGTRDARDAVIDLTHDDQSLPIGLRVTVQFLSSGLPKQ